MGKVISKIITPYIKIQKKILQIDTTCITENIIYPPPAPKIQNKTFNNIF